MAANHPFVWGKNLPEWENKMSSLCIGAVRKWIRQESRDKFEKNHRIVGAVQWNPEFRQSSVPPSALGVLEVAEGSSVLVPSHVDDACFFQGKNRAHKRRRKYLGNPPPFPQCYMELGCKHSCFCLFVCFQFVVQFQLMAILLLQIKLNLLNDTFYLKDVSFPLMLLAYFSQVWVSKDVLFLPYQEVMKKRNGTVPVPVQEGLWVRDREEKQSRMEKEAQKARMRAKSNLERNTIFQWHQSYF